MTRITSVAPIRICDCGGWTDTWFAQHGTVFNVGVSPFVEVQIEASPNPEGRTLIFAENYGDTFEPTPSRERHPLLEAAVQRMKIPEKLDVRVNLFSEMPPGASTGTSAAVTVALVGALDRLTPGRMTAYEIARTAFEIETKMLGRQSGIQDQMCAAFGGLLRVEIFAYPETRVIPLSAPDDVWWELEHRLLLVYLGKTHDSSEVHKRVIHDLEDAGSEDPRLETLRRCADDACRAVLSADFDALARAMNENTEAQRALHPSLVSHDADAIIALAKEFGAAGCKLNGAGGEGGSLTLLTGPSMPRKRELIQAIHAASPDWRVIPTRISRLGNRVWERS